jgi:hypothetical protein
MTGFFDGFGTKNIYYHPNMTLSEIIELDLLREWLNNQK